MGGLQNDGRRITRFQRLLPSESANAPLVSWFESSKFQLGPGSRQIVPRAFRKSQKLKIDDDANGMNPMIFWTRIAAASPVKPCQGDGGARDQFPS